MAQFSFIHRSPNARPDLDTVHSNSRQGSPLRLVLKVTETNQVVSIRLADRLLVGRGGDGHRPDIDLTDLDGRENGLSRRHALFTYADNILFIEDLGSTNGTRINGFPALPGKPYRVHNGDELELGYLHLIVQLVHVPN